MFTEALHPAVRSRSTDLAFLHMYSRSFQKASHIRKFTITSTGASGWEVRDEQDSRERNQKSAHEFSLRRQSIGKRKGCTPEEFLNSSS